MKYAILVLTATALSVASFAATDNALEQLRSAARTNAGRYTQISRTVRHDAPTNDTQVVYEQRSSYQERLDSSRNLASATITSNSFLRVVNNQLQVLNAKLYTAATNYYAKSVTFSNACVIAQGLAQSAQAKINAELEELYADKTDLEEKIADTKYILLRPWLQVKLAAVEARIAKLEALTGQS